MRTIHRTTANWVMRRDPFCNPPRDKFMILYMCNSRGRPRSVLGKILWNRMKSWKYGMEFPLFEPSCERKGSERPYRNNWLSHEKYRE